MPPLVAMRHLPKQLEPVIVIVAVPQLQVAVPRVVRPAARPVKQVAQAAVVQAAPRRQLPEARQRTLEPGL